MIVLFALTKVSSYPFASLAHIVYLYVYVNYTHDVSNYPSLRLVHIKMLTTLIMSVIIITLLTPDTYILYVYVNYTHYVSKYSCLPMMYIIYLC